MKPFFAALLLLGSLNLYAQTPNNRLSGLVVELSSGRKPVADVKIWSGFANPVFSDRAGKFLLEFQGLEPGEAVRLQTQKAGWEVVNPEDLATQLPKNTTQAPVRLVLCQEGVLAANTRKFYDKPKDVLLAEYNRQVEKAKQLATGREKRLAELEEAHKRQLVQTRELSNKYARINFDDLTELEKRAFDLFQQGKITEAILELAKLDSERAIARAKREKTELSAAVIHRDSVIGYHANILLRKAEWYALQFQFDEAERTYEIAVLADTTNHSRLFAFAHHLQNQKQYDKALRWYASALRQAKTDEQRAAALNNMGNVHSHKNDFPAALTAYKRALAIRERLAQTNPQIYEPEVAATLNNLGNLLSLEIDFSAIDFSAALTAFQQALSIYERLAQTNPLTYYTGVATTLNNLGILHRKINDFPAALAAYQRALSIRERLAQFDPHTYDPDLAGTLNNIGLLYHAKSKFPAALASCQRALFIYERIAQTNLQAYEPEIAMTLNNLGLIHHAKNDFPAALTAYKQALIIHKRLAAEQPARFDLDYCQTLLGTCVLNYSRCRQSPRKSLADSSLVFLRTIRDRAIKYGVVPAAQSYITRASKLETYFRTVSEGYAVLELQQRAEESKSAPEKLVLQEKVINDWQQILVRDTSNQAVLLRLCWAYDSQAWYLLFEQRFAHAEQAARRGLSGAGYPKPNEKFDEDVEWIHTNLALALLFQGKYDEAQAIYARLKDKPYDGKTYRETFLADLDELEKAGISHPDVAKIRVFLNE